MRTLLAIVCVFIMSYAAMPQRVCAQTRAMATVTATVIPSISIELLKSSANKNEESSPSTINIRGTGNILVVVDSKGMKSSHLHQLTIDQPLMITIPVSSQICKTSIVYMSS